MEGPYRDLGAGFARLAGSEGTRRAPSRISCVEDALYELLRNSRDAGARNVYVASTLRDHRYRTLTVLDDGCGIPETHIDLVFEPGVTTRHLDPELREVDPTPHGAGLSLYHLKEAATEARISSAAGPTSITATFDTSSIPERSLQSGTRNSCTNLRAVLRGFAGNTPHLHLYHGSPARILTTLIKNRIIQRGRSEEILDKARGLGLGVSLRTVQRVIRGEVGGASTVSGVQRDGTSASKRTGTDEGVRVTLDRDETAEIEALLRRMVGARYLEVGDLRQESRPGEISLKVRIYELEDEYE